MVRDMLRGAAAGAAGTTALNAVTYLDMAWRARPASTTPSDTVDEAVARTPVDVPGEGDDRDNRVSAVGALTGLATGVGVGVAYGLVRAVGLRPPRLVGAVLASAAALVGSNGPMTALGVTDPRSWSGTDWVSDVVPHVAYGIVTAYAFSDAAS